MRIRYLYWELSNCCNLRCRQCFAGATGDASTIIDQKTLYRGIDRIRQFGRIAIRFGGGEPLLVPFLADLIRHCTDLGIPVDLTSNGMLLNEAAVHSLSEAGLRGLTISMDGMEATHDFFRGNGTCRRIERNLARIPAARPFELSLAFTVTACNYREIVPFAEHHRSAGIRKFFFFRYCGEKSGELLRLNREQLAEAAASIRRLSALYPDTKFIMEPLSFFQLPVPDRHGYEGCNFLRGTLTVNYKGDVVVCAAIPKAIGNIYREDPEILKEKIEEEMRLIRQIPDACGRCDHRVSCHGGCKEYSYRICGDYSQRDTLCPFAQPRAALSAAAETIPGCP